MMLFKPNKNIFFLICVELLITQMKLHVLCSFLLMQDPCNFNESN